MIQLLINMQSDKNLITVSKNINELKYQLWVVNHIVFLYIITLIKNEMWY